jgi:Ca2+/Na+ antiporter
MIKISEKKMKRQYVIIFEGIVLAIIFLLVFTFSTILWIYLQKINNNLIYIGVLMFLFIFAIYSITKNEKIKKSKPRTNMILYQADFKEQVPTELKPILDLVYYPFFRAMNAEEYRDLEIDQEFFKRMRIANINLEQNLLRSSNV